MKLNIMTYNIQSGVNYISKETDFKALADVIKKYNADIIGMNEVWNSGDESRKEQVKKIAELSDCNYYKFAKAIEFSGEEYGNGFLSKIPFKKAEVIPIPDPEVKMYNGYYETRCLLKVGYESGLTVLVTHFGLNRDEHLNALKTILDNLTEKKCVLMGDFNVEPDSDILTEIRKKMTDTADFFEGERLSWPSDKPEMKIDYIFVTPDIKVLSADIPEVVLSDHRPYLATIEF